MEGFGRTTPVIRKVTFNKPDRFEVSLEDGRSITLPISKFPSLQKIPTGQRSKYKILNGDTLLWPDCDEVYHIQDLFGFPESYVYKG